MAPALEAAEEVGQSPGERGGEREDGGQHAPECVRPRQETYVEHSASAKPGSVPNARL